MATLSPTFENDQMLKITSEFRRLGDRCYLDNAGATLYPECLLKQVNDDLLNNVYMNPHSDKYTEEKIDQIRRLVLQHFNTDESEYTVIFTSGTTQSLKLVVEAFQFSADDKSNCGSFVHLRENHTSVLGLREIARDKCADIVNIPHKEFLAALNSPIIPQRLYKSGGNNLLAYPAQSNFNGYKYPIFCIKNIKNGCLNKYIKNSSITANYNWFVLLDAASYIVTNKLDLSKIQPDFVCLSFYKLFGFPTGLGALIVKNTCENVLTQRKYFGGGTIDALLSSENYHVKKEVFHERFEDGTMSFLSIIALKHGFDMMNKLIPKVINGDIMETISLHTFYLAKDLYEQLLELKHKNGVHAVIFYMDSTFDDIKNQGGTVTFNLVREDGSYIGYTEFQNMADIFNINIRTGCFCNSGSCQRHLEWTNEEMKDMYRAGHRCGDEIDLLDGKPTGAIRVSFGFYNTFDDVDRLIQMICRCFIKVQVNKPKRMLHVKNIVKMSNGNINKTIKDFNYSKTKNNIFKIPYAPSINLEKMCVYPIKSCGAFTVGSAWNIGPKGLEYDREWVIVKDNGSCLTQIENSRMCAIKPEINIKLGTMMLKFKGKPSISIPLDINSKCHNRVCSDIINGYDCGDDVANWLTDALKVSYLRLIRNSSQDNKIPNKQFHGQQTSVFLRNNAKFLLINKATVRWLSEKLQVPSFDNIEKLTDRLRGNLITDMEQELAERDWQKVIIGKHEFKVEDMCPRFQSLYIDQQTGEETAESMNTVTELFGGKPRLGIYLTYNGTIDGTNDSIIELYSPIKPIVFV